MLLEEDVVMEKDEESRIIRPSREPSPPKPPRAHDEHGCDAEDPLPFPLSPPPMPWPRVFPGL